MLGALVSGAPRAQACSPNFDPLIEPARADEVLPATTVFRTWAYAREVISARLLNESGQLVPGELVTSRVPTPVCLEREQYCEFRPFAPLAPGKYRFHIETGYGYLDEPVEFTVGTQRDELPPDAPQSLTASVRPMRLPTRVNSDCTAIFGERHCVVLELKAPVNGYVAEARAPGLTEVYELSWTPSRDGKPDPSRQRTISGVHPFWGPIRFSGTWIFRDRER